MLNKTISGNITCAFPSHINDNRIQSNQEHCENTGAYARSDLECVMLGVVAYLAGLLHDCGKFSDEFRDYIMAASNGADVKRGSVIHSFAGVYYLISNNHNPDDNDTYVPLTAELLAFAVGSHHGLFDCIAPDKTNGFIKRLKKQPHFEKQAIDNFLHVFHTKEDLDNLFKKAVMEVEEKINLIAGLENNVSCQEELYAREVQFHIGLLARLISSAVIDGDRRDTASFMMGEEKVSAPEASSALWKRCIENLESFLETLPALTTIERNRREISEICASFASKPAGIYRLNVPTGGGKTLASLRYALVHAERYSKKRIIYTAPFLSILDQNASIIRKALGDDSIILEHHSNVVRAEDLDEASVYELMEDAWDAPVIITTMVQLLNTFFSGRISSVRRFQALCDSILIIDEVQSVPARMLSIFNMTLNFLNSICGATIVLCSATQPCFQELRHKLNVSENDIISRRQFDYFQDSFRRTKLIDCGNYRLAELPELIDRVLLQSNSLLVICNTKWEAGELFKNVRVQYEYCYHLSASMCMSHRKQVLNQIFDSLKKRRKVVCISTQVIEAGVDISFGAVIRLAAGIDSIVQAAGRCNRNGEQEGQAPVYIVRCSDERLGNLSDIKATQDAVNQLLTSFNANPEQFQYDLSSDEAVSYYYKSLYGIYSKDYFDMPVKGYPSILEMLSDNETYSAQGEKAEEYCLRQAFKTAGKLFEIFDQDNESVIVPFEGGKEIIRKLALYQPQADFQIYKKLLEDAKPFMVSVYRRQLAKLEKEGGVSSLCDKRILVLREEWYDSDIGLQTQPVEKEGSECDILIL